MDNLRFRASNVGLRACAMVSRFRLGACIAEWSYLVQEGGSGNHADLVSYGENYLLSHPKLFSSHSSTAKPGAHLVQT